MEKHDLNALLAERLSTHVGPGKQSQAAFAEKAGLSQRTISNTLTPANRNNDKVEPKAASATLATVQACADALGVNPWELLMPANVLEQFRLFQQLRASLAMPPPPPPPSITLAPAPVLALPAPAKAKRRATPTKGRRAA